MNNHVQNSIHKISKYTETYLQENRILSWQLVLTEFETHCLCL